MIENGTPEQRAEVDLTGVANELRRIRDYSRTEAVIDRINVALIVVEQGVDDAIEAHFENV